MTAYRLHRLGWTQEEIGEAIGVAQYQISRQFLCEFPDLEKGIKQLLTNGIPHLDVAYQFLREIPELEKDAKKLLDSGIPHLDVAEQTSHGALRGICTAWTRIPPSAHTPSRGQPET